MTLLLTLALAEVPEHLVNDAGAYWADPTGKLAELSAWARAEEADVLLLDAPSRINLEARSQAPLIAFRAAPPEIYRASDLGQAALVAWSDDLVQVYDLPQPNPVVDQPWVTGLRRIDALQVERPGDEVRYWLVSGDRISNPVDVRYVNDTSTWPERRPEAVLARAGSAPPPSDTGLNLKRSPRAIDVGFRVDGAEETVPVDLVVKTDRWLHLRRVASGSPDGDQVVGRARIELPEHAGAAFVFVAGEAGVIDGP